MTYLLCYSCYRHAANPAKLSRRHLAVWRVASTGVTSHALSGDRVMTHALPDRAKLSTDQRNCHRNSLMQNDGELDLTFSSIYPGILISRYQYDCWVNWRFDVMILIADCTTVQFRLGTIRR